MKKKHPIKRFFLLLLLVVLVALKTQEAVAAQLVAATQLAAHSTNKLRC